MKGVIARINPNAQVIDLSHEVPAHDVNVAAFLLASAFAFFPKGTIHVVVVDPTVGTERLPLCVESGDYFFVGPDNGVLSIACTRSGLPKIYRITRYCLEKRGRTFHGRDVFAPVAAHLSAGAPLESVGPRVESMERISTALPFVQPDLIEGEIIHVDRFGNLITNIGQDTIERAFPGVARCDLVITCGNTKGIGLHETYAEVPIGRPVGLFSSYDLLEIAVREGSATTLLSAGRGDRARVEKRVSAD
ncbi:MAG: hypothetical protein Kow0099_34460 [Candidatus Abyssubacteria bacterium]